MPQKYTVQSPEGKTITFEWNHPIPPNDSDFEQIFKDVGGGYNQAAESQAINEVQRQNIMAASRAKAQEKFAPFISPFSYIAKKVGANPVAASMLDAFSPVPLAASAAQTMASIPSAPNFPTAASRFGLGLAKTGLSGLNFMYPVGFGGFGAGADILNRVSPEAGQALNAVTNPVSTILQPQTELGQNAAQALDIGLQTGAYKLANRSPNYVKKGNVNLDRAFPVKSGELTRPADRARLAPYLKVAENQNPTEIGNINKGGTKPSIARQLSQDVIPNIKNEIYGQQDALIQANGTQPLLGGTDQIANSIESLRNIYTKNIDILKDKSILTEAEKYRNIKSLTLKDAFDLQKSLNAGLQDFYKKSAESRAAAENLGKPIAEMEKAVGSLRDQIVQTLNSIGEDGNLFREKSLDYGAAVKLEAAAERNIPKAESPLPPLFTERSSTLYPSRPGVLRDVAEHTVGKFFTPDKLAKRALTSYAKSNLPEPTPLISRAPTTGTIMGPPTFPTSPVSTSPPPSGVPVTSVDLMRNKLDLLKQSVTPGIDEGALKTTVEAGGGKYVGIQESGGEPLVEFNDKSGGTHALPMSQATPENISNYLKTNSLKSTQETMIPKITPEDLAAYRQYIASGGNLNVSDWMKTRK